MATRKPLPPPAADAPPPATESAPLTLQDKAARAVAEVADYQYVDFVHDGQQHVAWRSRNGAVHIENRG